MRIILIGPPGSGKRTQSELLASTLRIPHISTGAHFRWHIANNTTLGKAVKPYFDAGDLVPGVAAERIVAERLSNDDVAAGFILAGFPCTQSQARVLDTILARRGDEVEHVIEFVLDTAESKERMVDQRRASDDLAAHRHDVYQRERDAILAHYGSAATEVNVSGSVEEIKGRLLSALGARVLEALGVHGARSLQNSIQPAGKELSTS